MAVAVHVGRVAKEYAPYGYSIMIDSSSSVGAVAAGAGNTPLTLVDDVEIYIESAQILWHTQTPVGVGDTSAFVLAYADNDGAFTNPVIITSVAVVSTDGVDEFHALDTAGPGGPIVPADKIIYIRPAITAGGGSALTGTVARLRYRRKA